MKLNYPSHSSMSFGKGFERLVLLLHVASYLFIGQMMADPDSSGFVDTTEHAVEVLNQDLEDDESKAFEAGFTLIDVNTASRQELLTLPTMNDVYVDAILTTRPYQTWDELQHQSQLPDLVIDSIKPYATLYADLGDVTLAKPWQAQARAMTWYHSKQPFGTGVLQLQVNGPMANSAGCLTLMQAGDVVTNQHVDSAKDPTLLNPELALAYVQAQVGPWVGIVGHFNVGFASRLLLDTSGRVVPDGFYVNHAVREDIVRGKMTAVKAFTGVALAYHTPSGQFSMHSFVGHRPTKKADDDQWLLGAHAIYRYHSRIYIGTLWHQQPWHVDPKLAKLVHFGVYGAVGMDGFDTVFELGLMNTGGFAAVVQHDVWFTKQLSLQVAGHYYGVDYNNFYSRSTPALYGSRAYARRNNQRVRIGLQASMPRWFSLLQIEQGSPVQTSLFLVESGWQPWRVQRLQQQLHVRLAKHTILKTRVQFQQTHLLSYTAKQSVITRPLAVVAMSTELWPKLKLSSACSWRMLINTKKASQHWRASLRVALDLFENTWLLARLHVGMPTFVPAGRAWLWQASIGLRQTVGPYVAWHIHTGMVQQPYDSMVWMNRLFLQMTY